MAVSLGFVSPLWAENRLVQTQYGQIDVPEGIKRVVTLHEGALDAAVALGIEPLGAIATRGGKGVATYLADSVPEITIVGTAREINIEAILALRPDLILASPTMQKRQYNLLSKLAPTIVPAVKLLSKDAWKNNSRVYAQALGKSVELEKILINLDQRITSTKNQLGQEGLTATLVRWTPQGPLLMSPDINSAQILAQVGFQLKGKEAIKAGRPHSDPLSQENLNLINAQWLFLSSVNQDGNKALQTAKLSPAFTRLEAVKNNRVIVVDGQLWTSSSGPLSAKAILDDLQQQVLSTQKPN
ncbi:ABC transporter substrate-binding protein [Marinibactrum halimedae]|uniref:ABC transporter substrate-binding protein n=1 Tax=Marinibactrum halimedae TaxID=1444977 RepID=UPI001E601742|nr:iron-siderophore ABC transporter substrate-binding protein [Marinibactrum halimedae]MCD9457962.1 iron-siderophore ABC transporter substrate-binding protein [Marinibactrum halimedae]